MNKLFLTIKKISKQISSILLSISVLAMIIWPLVMIFYVILRSLDIGWLFVEEFTEYWLLMIIFFSLSYTYKSKGNISVDVMVRNLSERNINILGLITKILTSFVFIYILFKSIGWIKFAFYSYMKSQYPSQILLWPIYCIIPIGLVSLVLESFLDIYEQIKKVFFRT